jgi:acetylglutamate kinase
VDRRNCASRMLIVLKYGGNAMAAGSDDPVLDEIASLAQSGMSVIVVHGGGPQIDAALRARGIPEERVEGLRVTTAAARDIVESVLCGNVNKDLVRGLLARGARAFGFSGLDGGVLKVRRMRIAGHDLGFVGEPASVNAELLRGLLTLGLLPVIAPMGLDPSDGAALNLNADTVAGAIAAALQADAYVVLTNVAGVRRDRNDPATVIPRLTIAQANRFLDDGTFSDGMRPKMRAAIEAVEGGARRALIAEAARDGIGAALAGAGTELVSA